MKLEVCHLHHVNTPEQIWIGHKYADQNFWSLTPVNGTENELKVISDSTKRRWYKVIDEIAVGTATETAVADTNKIEGEVNMEFKAVDQRTSQEVTVVQVENAFLVTNPDGVQKEISLASLKRWYMTPEGESITIESPSAVSAAEKAAKDAEKAQKAAEKEAAKAERESAKAEKLAAKAALKAEKEIEVARKKAERAAARAASRGERVVVAGQKAPRLIADPAVTVTIDGNVTTVVSETCTQEVVLEQDEETTKQGNATRSWNQLYSIGNMVLQIRDSQSGKYSRHPVAINVFDGEGKKIASGSSIHSALGALVTDAEAISIAVRQFRKELFKSQQPAAE